MRRAYVSFFVTVIFLLLGLSSSALALSYPKNSTGEDISWPNCNNLNFKPSVFGIVGVNGGLSLRPNKCIGDEASLYKQSLSLYVNTGFPGSPYDIKYANYPKNCSLNDVSCLAYNYGYNSGKYATNYALSSGVVANNWWLDVETINSWTTNSSINKSSLQGEVDAIRQSVNPSTLGFYSFPPEWVSLTGNWRPGSPNWVATNSNYKSVAVSQCKDYNFTGGLTFLAQYIGSLDFDLTC